MLAYTCLKMLVGRSGLGHGLDQNSDLTKPVRLLIKLAERVQRYCISQELHDGALGRSMLVIAP